MTEEQWLACTEPNLMLDFLRHSRIARERKLRLFAAACCRRVWHLLDADGRVAVETSERFADGLATEAELMDSIWANRGCQDIDARAAVDSAAVGAWQPAVALLAAVSGHPPGSVSSPADSTALAQERAQADLLRCVFGPLPFRMPGVEPRWRTPVVLSLAQAAYEERIAPAPSQRGWLVLDPALLLVLADALEESGCTDAELLGHLRGQGPHVRGCFMLDLLLGKE
jgi:hypothetical protein